MSDTPLYVSKCSLKNFWQEYRIYDDRLEFDTLFGRMTVPFEHVETAVTTNSDVADMLKGDLKLKGFRSALKLDWANVVEHVVLDRDNGLLKRLLFSPDDPSAFCNALNSALDAFRARNPESAASA
jgi:hypothetical protein